MSFPYGLEVRMLHCVLWSDSLSMIVSKHLTQQIKSFIGYQMVVLSIDKLVPRLARLSSNKIVVMIVQCKTIFVNVCEEIVSSQNLGNLDKLVIVVTSLEERLFLKNHPRKHAA